MGLSTRSPWRTEQNGYRSLDDLHTEKATVAWYWRFVAQIASFMILGGYLILPNTFDTTPNLRFNKGVLAIIIVALLTGGYSLTALLWFACPSILFRLDAIFIPVFASSVFAFLATLYAFASSSRYSFSEAMGPTTLGMAAASSIIYGVMALIAQRQVQRMCGPHQNSISYHRSLAGTPTSGLWAEPIYYQNFNQNMHPTARSPNSFEAPPISIHNPPSDEEMVNQQMAMLLTKHDPGPSPDASQTTFRLEWPQGEEDEIDPATGRRRQRTFSASSGLLAPNPGPTRGYRGRSESVQDGRSTTWSKLGRVMGVDRGRPDSRGGPSHVPRAKSRDERRREIELGQL